ncbi:MAG: hypothetical protein OXN90_19135 [Gemmatimonadota bacterium]|nr:hypothetical protein [Gemmatimonadota bacterium]
MSSPAKPDTVAPVPGWDRLIHRGLLLDSARLQEVGQHAAASLDDYLERQLRQHIASLQDDAETASAFVAFALERIFGFDAASGEWMRGSQIPASWGRRAVTGETVKPRHLWQGPHGALLPVFLDTYPRLGIGRSRRTISQVIGWLRAGGQHLALATNGRQWRLIFAGLDYDASCEGDVELWFEEGTVSKQLMALRTLLQPTLWKPTEEDSAPPLLQAIRDTRKGQADLSQELGERVREAVELLIQGHGEVLQERCADVAAADIYRAACRVVMRLVVILFAESRELLPRENALYDAMYGLNGLLGHLQRLAARSGEALKNSHSAWPRVLALFQLVREGSHHPDLPVTEYGGELFAAGDKDASDGLSRVLAVFETACLERELLSDDIVYGMMDYLTRTRMKIRQGRTSTWMPAPVDFSDLSTEYIGVLYEGLLDYELKTASDDDPVVFLSRGDQPALPLSRLESMDDRALKVLFEDLKDTSALDEDDSEAQEEPAHVLPFPGLTQSQPQEPSADVLTALNVSETAPSYSIDVRQSSRNRAEDWARRAALTAGLVRRQASGDFEDRLQATAKRLIARVVLPDEWYLVRWGGTRKGSGSFYTRPGLAVPTVQRTLRPLAFDPPEGADHNAPPQQWIPKPPEDILALKVCDPASGSGTFPLAALRFLTDALYDSVQYHERIESQPDGERSLVRLLGIEHQSDDSEFGKELIPCRPDDDEFERRLKAVLRRHVVERCIYAVDLDPLAVELCRLSLWIETMERDLPFGFLDHKVKCGNALVGAWFDQFRHYPAMAWKNREGGDKTHSNGVHFEKNARTQAIKAFVKGTLTSDLKRFLQGRDLFQEDLLEQASTAHDNAFAILERIHALPVHDAAERADVYRRELLGSEVWRSLKEAMDLWCACWFWLADEIEYAPLPTTFADPPEETRAAAQRIAAEMRFFHWELEFPDVFREAEAGFDAILGNPPWETLQPISKEYFSNIDPLYRSYGKQEALRKQTDYFADRSLERHWLQYNAGFANDAHWMKQAGNPFGDPEMNTKSQDRFAVTRGQENRELHYRWRQARTLSCSFTDPAHPFRHRGSGKAYTYKLFLEQAHAVLRLGGRLGFIVPSGLYSDDGTGAMRDLFLNHCRWEWLFGIENRDGVFPIHRSFKFNPVIVEKGGTTEAIRTVFMCRKLEDWERAEEVATPYTRKQIEQFSPRNRAILEIQSRRDLEILEKIYANSVLLGDDGPDSWDIRYVQGDFNMTSDSKLFPPRPQWEAQGYHPDEYSRWLKGDWRPIEALWAELDVEPSRPAPAEIELEDWLFDTSAGSERHEDEACFVHGHLLKPGDVTRTDWRLRCAQPPYDRLPILRADIPEGVVMSREGDAWIREGDVEDVALPLYVGKMIYVNNWATMPVSCDMPGRSDLDPDFLLGTENLRHDQWEGARVVFRDIARNNDQRSFVSALLPGLFPCGNVLPIIESSSNDVSLKMEFIQYLTSFVFDWVTRQRMSGTHLNWHVAESLALPYPKSIPFGLPVHHARFALSGLQFAPDWVRLSDAVPRPYLSACSLHERLRLTTMTNAIAAATFGVSAPELSHILSDCDHPKGNIAGRQPKGFWRVDQDKSPELRHTVLTQIAFQDLEDKIIAAGDRDQGIEAFLTQNHGEGWMPPETLRLADYGLGRDDRAQQFQPVASRLGPRFYDWQLVQTAEESWRECHLHARNLLGADGYTRLLSGVDAEEPEKPLPLVAEPRASYGPREQPIQQSLFTPGSTASRDNEKDKPS